MHATVVEVNGNVEICEMGIPTFVKKNVVRFDVPVLGLIPISMHGLQVMQGNGPEHDMRFMEVSEGGR
jgi:hypothetical protein